ncbi:MAG: hypothetical protein ACRC62_17420 [Microcoleus sp.]
MNRLILFLLILLLTASSAIALPKPTSENHQISFGTPIETYEIEPGLIAMVTRDSQGNPLDAIVQGAVVPQPRSNARSVEPYPIYLNLKEQQLEELIDRLVPPKERGEKSKYNTIGICADVCISNYSYENVTISLIWNAKWRDNKEPFSPLRSGPSRLTIHWNR